ncbi:MAG: 4,5-DOPA dioxygenase extradiol [Gammaproteobacteria bacterium]|nr:MAG: 4,5-DOPA dioxygenase extradiol [Gammaproteobacteria bacterium]
MVSSTRTPAVFLGHGSPTNAIEDNECTRAWARIAERIARPKAILSISAHWYTRGTYVTAMANPRTIHDFGAGLPAPLFSLQYPAPGDPALARRIQSLLAPLPVALDERWGLDHGTWSVLLKAYPEADIPVVQLSIDATRPGAWHHQLGRQLRPLRDEGVLILGTGNVVHNLGVMEWSPHAEPYDWATRFNDYVIESIRDDQPERLFDGSALGRDAALSIPSPDHYLPLLYVLGARHPGDRALIEPDHIVLKSLSMMSFMLDDRPTTA